MLNINKLDISSAKSKKGGSDKRRTEIKELKIPGSRVFPSCDQLERLYGPTDRLPMWNTSDHTYLPTALLSPIDSAPFAPELFFRRQNRSGGGLHLMASPELASRQPSKAEVTAHVS